MDDYEYWIRAARSGYKFGFAPPMLATYNKHGSQLGRDRMLNTVLTIRLWQQQVDRHPEDELAMEQFRQKRLFISHYWANTAFDLKGMPRVQLLWRALALYPEPRNVAKILSGRTRRR